MTTINMVDETFELDKEAVDMAQGQKWEGMFIEFNDIRSPRIVSGVKGNMLYTRDLNIWERLTWFKIRVKRRLKSWRSSLRQTIFRQSEK